MNMTADSLSLARVAPRFDSATVDVVYMFSNATWQAAWRRGFFMPEDRFVRSLLASERVGRMLVCNHYRSLPVKVVRDLTGTDRAPFPADERTWLVEPVRLRRRDPATIPAVKRGFAAYDRVIERAVRRHGLHDPVVITGHPLVAGFSELKWARAVTWYAIDDWSEHPAYSRWRSAYLASYERVRVSGRRVAAVSSPLLERLAPTGPGIVVENGIDPGEWTGAVEPPAWADELPRPLMVYVGALDSRLDIPSLAALAQSEPSASIALVGPLVEPDHFAPLRVLPNVHFRGPVDRARLTGLIRSADVGLLPHLKSRLTEAMSPLKLMEYLAGGLPVASTDLTPVREFGDPRVILVREGGDYALGVRTALAMGRASEADRHAFIEANSWRSRHERVLDLAFSS
jgi:glycosyltransferase involved in cell wall biosynthesis